MIRLALLFFFLSSLSLAAQSSNPFAIRSTVDSAVTKLKSDSGKIVVQGIEQGLSNPFVLRKSETASTNLIPKEHWSLKLPSIPLGTTDSKQVKNLIFWTLMFLTFLLAVAINLNRSLVANMFKTYANVNYLGLLVRESKDGSMTIYFILYALYFLGLSVFLYILVNQFKGLHHPYYLLIFASFVCLMYLIRHLSIRLIGRCYDLSVEFSRLNFSIIIFGCTMALILIPMDFIIAFVEPDLGNKLSMVMVIIFIAAYLLRSGRDILLSVNSWRNAPFHFFLYLCSCEIAPLLLLFVFLKRQGQFS
ncbi:MAG TPA: DUF4271 domain-containing protein [Saprospiraceae bacterium]|nr:DUF4271 domain-containing protein [Saprospiraceae bacterium]